MPKPHPKNERVKRQYLGWMEEARGRSKSTADDAAASIAAFERSTGHRDFASFHIEQARKFRRDILEAVNSATGKRYARATVTTRLKQVRAFFLWLADQPGYRSRIRRSDCDYFNPTRHDLEISNARREKRFPSEAQIQRVIEYAPHNTPIDKRNRALVAFAYATGARCDVLASISLQHVNLEEDTIFQDARSVRTKFRKSFTSVFFPVGERFLDIIREWIHYLIEDCHFGPTDPLFPPTMMARGEDGLFSRATFSRSHWKQTNSIRTIFRKLFEHADLPYYHPHSFRDTLVQKGERECPNHESFKGWSQNLGHEHVATTHASYAPISLERRRQLLAEKSAPTSQLELVGDPSQEVVDWVLGHISQRWRDAD